MMGWRVCLKANAKNGFGGYPLQSPYISIVNRQAEIMMRLASELGFTPASRSRITVSVERDLPLFD
jgi:phage terminase small subunit